MNLTAIFSSIVIANTIFAVALFADGTQSSEGEKWVGPIMTSVVNLAATVFAYLTSRDRLRYDSSHAIKDARIAELQDDKKQSDTELTRYRRRVNRLARNMIALQQTKPLPFPNELGFSTDEDEGEPTVK